LRQWPKYQEAGVPRDVQGVVNMNAPTPPAADGKPDFSGMWMRASSAQPRGGGGRCNQDSDLTQTNLNAR